MFITPKEKGLSQEQINKICEDLWTKEKPRRCPDCGVEPGSKHDDNCDVARCTECGGQRLSCDCENGSGDSDTWEGLWPGVKECYQMKLICYDTCRYPDNGEELGWGFDLNTWSIMDMTKNK
jgi:hypothetical protein